VTRVIRRRSRVGTVARFRQDMKVARLKALPLFEDLSRRQLIEVARLTDDLDVPAGTVLCNEGSRGDEFFVIIDGEAAVTRDGEHLATLRGGDFFGEIAVIEPVRRTATVTAVTPLRFFLVSERAFQSLLDTNPEIERKVLRTLARRLVALSGEATLG
jgi:CRP/FNR family cyclic AMP-dependent transcriptional regulator